MINALIVEENEARRSIFRDAATEASFSPVILSRTRDEALELAKQNKYSLYLLGNFPEREGEPNEIEGIRGFYQRLLPLWYNHPFDIRCSRPKVVAVSSNLSLERWAISNDTDFLDDRDLSPEELKTELTDLLKFIRLDYEQHF